MQTLEDGSALQTTTYPSGKVESLTIKTDGTLYQKSTTTPDANGNTDTVVTDAADQFVSLTHTDYFYDETGVSRIETITTPTGTVFNTYDVDSNLVTTETVSDAGLSNADLSQAANVATDLISFQKTLTSNAPDAYKFASGLVLLNKNINIPDPVTGQLPYANFNTIATVGQGALSLYNLDQAWRNGDGLAKLSATGNALNFANQTLIKQGLGSSALNTTLNGTGFANGGTVGVLPAIGLISSIEAGDPIGIAQSCIALYNPALLFSSGVGFTPLGWFFVAVSVMQALFAEGPPKAWGVANITYRDGITNLELQVNANGDSFGTDRARQGMQSIVDYLQHEVVDKYNASHSVAQQVGIIAQRMPGLAWRANDAGDPGYRLTDIDPLTGEQRYPYRRFDDSGVPFSSDPAAYQVDPTDPNQRGSVNQALVMSAYNRDAIAPLWEVKTAKLQAEAGAPNAGLSEEERAAKAGYSAPLDTACAATHSADDIAKNKRVGHFMAVGLDLDNSGTISTTTVAQNAAKNNGAGITFNWDNQDYQKEVGWVSANDGMLVLDRNFNQSADNGGELLSNPLVADPAKGLRSLATWDANGDGRIDASDPIYYQLKVWQDFDQDGNNTHVLTINDASGAHSVLAQDETNGTKELRSLQEMGISAIDYANNRYELDSGLRATGIASGQISYASIQTVGLEAEQEGTHYVPVGAGIKIDSTDGSSVILITQVQSEQAIYSNLTLATAGETVGTPDALLYEDGVPGPWNPIEQGYLSMRLNTATLIANDTWHGQAAGLQVTAVGNASHLAALSLNADGSIGYQLEANYSGSAGFDYAVTAPDGTSALAHVALNVTPVNDVPVVASAFDTDRPIYGYRPLQYSYTKKTGWGDDSVTTTWSGVARGDAQYGPYTDYIAPQPIYSTMYYGEDAFTYISGYTPEQYIPHTTVIASDKPNTGHINASDPDGGGFTYQLVQDSLYGHAVVDAAGGWGYTGLRPKGFAVGDVNADGRTDYANPDTGTVVAGGSQFTGDPNSYSNRYGPDEGSFIDPFIVRVTDTQGVSQDVQVNATHYGPRPIEQVAGSGGKKPIAIDLNGDGFHFTDVDDSNVFFDVNGDGWKRRIAWSNPADGLIAFDKNGDGKIDSFDEISFVPYAKDQQTDLSALKKAFDTNGDGVFDARDDKWASFGVWQDANNNGVSDPGEFKTMAQMGISAINLASDGQFQVIDGQTVHGVASATKTDGSTLTVADVTLRYKNQTQITTTNTDGSTNTSVVGIPASQKGQEFIGTAGKDLVFGTDGNDHFATGDGDDVIVDNKGDDLMEVGAGNDLVYTGQGNDVVDAGDGNDSVFAGAGNDMVFGGNGDDLLMLEDGNDVVFGGDGNDFISGGAGNDVLSGNLGDDKLFGEDGWDALFGQEGNDELYGMEGNDALYGQEGNDLLDGGAGDDAMKGGTGNDTYVVDSAGDVATELAGEGTDTVRASINYTLGANVENLTLTGGANLNGTGNTLDNLLTGNDGNNILTAGAGNDVLDGGFGADTLIGGTGDDTYVVDNPGDAVIEAAGEGVDTVRSRISTTLAANVENLTLLGINAIDGTGNELDNVLTGNAASNLLSGGAGNDTYVLQRGGGRDTVIDSAGNTDSVLVRGNLTAADISLTRRDLDVIVTIKNTNDALVLKNWFGDVLGQESAGAVEAIRFENGSQSLDSHYIHSLLDNHAPVAVDDSAAVQEDGAASVTGNVLANDSDIDLPYDSRQHLDVANAGVFQGSYGSIALAADGSYSYSLNNSAANVQALGRDVEVTDTFTYSVQDHALDSKSASTALTVTITGSNDGPQAISDVADVNEDGTVTTVAGNLLTNDTDVDAGDTLNVVAPGTLQGTYGSLVLEADGGYIYTLNNSATNVQSLRGGQVVTDSFAYAATDGLASSASSLTVTITGTNDAPVAFADAAAAKEDTTLTIVGNVLGNDNDADQGTMLSVANAGTLTGTYGSLVLGANGAYTYTLNNSALAVQSLGAGQTATDVFTYTATDDDSLPLTATSTLTVTVAGTNDAPVIANPVATQAARENQAFTFTIPLGTFTDIDNPDVLSYSAKAVNASGNLQALPNWLSFNAVTRSFSGTPDSAAGGSFDFVVTAADLAGASAASRFTVNISDEFAGTGANAVLITGNNYDNVLNGTSLNETIIGKAGTDTLYGGAGDDTLDGGTGADLLFGDAGNDTLKFGVDRWWQHDAYVTNAGSPGKAGSGQRLEIEGMNRSLDAFDGGTGIDTMLGTSGNDAIVLDDGAQRMKNMEAIDAGTGDDVVDLTSPTYALGDMLIKGGAGNDVLWASSGNDILQGGDGCDRLDGGAGKAVLDGGAGDDTLSDSDASSLLFGGKGSDALYAGKGADLIGFNKGDGADVLYRTAEAAANDTISLGNGIKYADLKLRKHNLDLVLDMGVARNNGNSNSDDRLTLKNWYATPASGTSNKTVSKLQVVTVGGDYNAASTDKTKNQLVEEFDFAKLVQAFDAAWASKQSNANGWAMMNSMLDAHLAGSNTAALGGDLAYQYATQGSLSGIGLQAAQASMTAGSDWQTLNSRTQVEQGSVKLA